MTLNVQTTKQIADSNLANYENKLSQISPLNDKAFLRVQSGINALNFTQLVKLGVERARQNLATTATGGGLALVTPRFFALIIKGVAGLSLSADTAVGLPVPEIMNTMALPDLQLGREVISLISGARFAVR